MQVQNHPYMAIFGLSRPSEKSSAPLPEADGHTGAPAEAASDQVELSPQARALSAAAETSEGAGIGPQKELSQEDQEKVEKLKARDREVRNHEQAHKAAAGGYATSGPTYEYESGPDGKRYAVGGEVGIDTSPVSGDPAATIRKAQVIQRAASAPAEPSSQDRQVAAQAAQMEAEARQELQQERMEESKGASAAAQGGERAVGSEAAGATRAASQGGMAAYGLAGSSGFDRGGSARAGQLLNLVA